MKTKLMILIIFISITLICGCTQSDITKIDQLSSQINSHLQKGDDYYNQSAKDINNDDINASLDKCDSAFTEYNSARTLTSQAQSYAQSAQDDVYIQYLQLVLSEIDAKLNATSELRTAGQLFQTGDNETANSNLRSANSMMVNAQDFQKQKEQLVKENPNKFK
ncbi:MAG: hypothetical protein CVV28_03705 [Methanobacteriales archaeon HGW-Methanobacteriales-1]|nr:hypothetical protein [Methanobacteriaceae archaeon]MDP3484790.1 hypothetical protein [Methanobacteriaceae archaeon]PKL67841.1 MAG: hypothetical protein CVV28_03705 [Methanobacteriales archaeon HGW-Methanobacteriales-1]